MPDYLFDRKRGKNRNVSCWHNSFGCGLMLRYIDDSTSPIYYVVNAVKTIARSAEKYRKKFSICVLKIHSLLIT